jgi:hypothetical protein
MPMRRNIQRVAFVAAFAVAGSAGAESAMAQGAPVAMPAPPPPSPTNRPAIKAARVSGGIALDGRLDEAAWAGATPATSFLQFDPQNGQPATQRTEVRFLYGDDALYIGARMYDTEGAKGVRTQLARRDGQSDGDYLEFVFDTYHDHAGRTMLQINPSGVKFDAGQASPQTDPSWDPIWEASTHTDDEGWVAEMRIPFSQLRFPRDSVQTWGMQIWRYEQRLNETSMWAHWGKNDPGGPQLFGTLEELHVPPRKLGVELLPYAVASNSPPAFGSNPIDADRKNGWRLGGDMKALLSSSLTLDATFNPDFGQVEVDPAVVNLSAFETFFPEKRPFFVEGSGLFGFGSFNCFFCSNASNLSLFYSRRIGRSPQGFLTDYADHLQTPDNSTIIGAAKVTGRTSGGYQVGLLNAVTASERAHADDILGNRYSQEVEPLTNYFVGRVKRAMNGGRFTIGTMVTSVMRKFDGDNPLLETIIPHHAEAGGVDWDVQSNDRRFDFMGSVALSQVNGDTATINRLQHSSARYFQRPDRDAHDNGFFTNAYDPSLTSLRGLGAYARVAKQSGEWLWEAATNIRTPGFETNDIAFLQRADYAWMNANILRQWTTPKDWYRNLSILAGAQQQLNFDGDVTDRQWRVSGNATFNNFWTLGSFVIVHPATDDDHATRGGPVVRSYGWWFLSPSIETDGRKRVVVRASPSYSRGQEGGISYATNFDVTFKPASNLLVSLAPNYARDRSTAQFVPGARFIDPTNASFAGQRIVFSDIDQHTTSLDMRVAATFTPNLTLELFAQPFIASADYTNFKEYTKTRSQSKRSFDAQQITELRDAENNIVGYKLDPDRDPATANFQFQNPDFNTRSLRGNAVLRWEYRPGSTVFFVWQQERAGGAPIGDFEFRRDTDKLFAAKPSNTFLVKLSYWVGR